MPEINVSQRPAESADQGKNHSASRTASTTDQATGFSMLPHELRDGIYDLLYLEDQIKIDCQPNFPPPNLIRSPIPSTLKRLSDKHTCSVISLSLTLNKDQPAATTLL
jgi:hypothetical protein